MDLRESVVAAIGAGMWTPRQRSPKYSPFFELSVEKMRGKCHG